MKKIIALMLLMGLGFTVIPYDEDSIIKDERDEIITCPYKDTPNENNDDEDQQGISLMYDCPPGCWGS